jgi:hypothetical protein
MASGSGKGRGAATGGTNAGGGGGGGRGGLLLLSRGCGDDRGVPTVASGCEEEDRESWGSWSGDGGVPSDDSREAGAAGPRPASRDVSPIRNSEDKSVARNAELALRKLNLEKLGGSY